MTLQFLKIAASIASITNIQTAVTFLFSLDFDWVCGILHNLSSATIQMHLLSTLPSPLKIRC